MSLYEHVFLARQDITSQQVEALAEQYKTIVEGNGGKITKTENWGLRALAYRVKKNRKAHYVLFNIDAPAAAVAELERIQSISEDVLRSLTVRVDELEDGPSAVLTKRDRDDRPARDEGREGRDRGDRGGRGGDRGGPRRDRGPRRDIEFGDSE